MKLLPLLAVSVPVAPQEATVSTQVYTLVHAWCSPAVCRITRLPCLVTFETVNIDEHTIGSDSVAREMTGFKDRVTFSFGFLHLAVFSLAICESY